jgi:acyl-CoA synthetase (AMP-forming)/AMP-acid ligase II
MVSRDVNVGRKLIAGRSIRWDEAQAVRAYDRGLWVRHTLADTLRQAARQTPDRVILIDGRHRIDCRSFCDQATVLAQAMLARAPAGSVVSFMLPNWHEAIIVYLAATMAGMVVNPILPSLRDRELQFILKDVDSRLIFVPSTFRQYDYAAMMDRVTAGLDRPPEVIVLRGEAGKNTAYESMFQHTAATELPKLDPDAVRMVLYTSGTTGRPKAVLHTHNSIHAMICQLRDNWGFVAGDTMFVPSPVGHITGLFCAIECPLILGLSAVLMDQWNADEAVRIVDAEQCTHIVGATPFLEQLLASSRKAGSRLPSLKLFACGGASVPPSLIQDSAAYFERAVVTRIYGSTEVPHITIGVPERTDAAHGAETDGRIDLTEVKLASHPAAPAGEGEVHARGPQMLVGYLNPDDETDAFDSEGYFRTGDVAKRVDDIYLVVTGRAKDIIIRNGENISKRSKTFSSAILILPRSPLSACPIRAPVNAPVLSSSRKPNRALTSQA